MVVIVKAFKLGEDNRLHDLGKVIDKFGIEGLDFDYTKPREWIKFIKKNYPDIVVEYKHKIRWHVYWFGKVKGTGRCFLTYFPGEKDGKALKVLEHGNI